MMIRKIGVAAIVILFAAPSSHAEKTQSKCPVFIDPAAVVELSPAAKSKLKKWGWKVLQGSIAEMSLREGSEETLLVAGKQGKFHLLVFWGSDRFWKDNPDIEEYSECRSEIVVFKKPEDACSLELKSGKAHDYDPPGQTQESYGEPAVIVSKGRWSRTLFCHSGHAASEWAISQPATRGGPEFLDRPIDFEGAAKK